MDETGHAEPKADVNPYAIPAAAAPAPRITAAAAETRYPIVFDRPGR